MKDEKKLSEQNKEEIVTGKHSGESSYSEESLHDELEKLAETFRQELKKAQEMSDEEFEEVYADELGVIPEEELCACCGEKRRDKSFGENYEYCADCRKAMCKYPLSVPGVLAAIVMVGLAIFSIINFASDFDGYDLVYRADKNRSDKKLSSAMTYYDNALAFFDEEEIVPKNVMLDYAEVMFSCMENGTTTMGYVSALLEDALSDFEMNLLVYSKAKNLYYENKIIYQTMQEFYTVVQNEEYSDFKAGDDEMYEKIMAEVLAIKDKELTVESPDGKTSEKIPADEATVRFCQYMFAYTAEKFDESYEYMKMVKDLAPSYYWLYAYEMGMAQLQSGEYSEARDLADLMINQNVENPDGYCLRSAVDRMNKRYTKAVKWVDDGLKHNPSNAELYRFKAMALCASGDYKEAKEAIDTAIETQNYAMAYMTAIVIETELGNSETVKEHKKFLKEQEIELTEKMNKYLDGEITATEMFTEGTGDVQ